MDDGLPSTQLKEARNLLSEISALPGEYLTCSTNSRGVTLSINSPKGGDGDLAISVACGASHPPRPLPLPRPLRSERHGMPRPYALIVVEAYIRWYSLAAVGVTSIANFEIPMKSCSAVEERAIHGQ